MTSTIQIIRGSADNGIVDMKGVELDGSLAGGRLISIANNFRYSTYGCGLVVVLSELRTFGREARDKF